MATYSERVFVSEFNVFPDGRIGVRKTTEILRDGEAVGNTHWRCVLERDDPKAEAVLDAEPFYLALAQAAWAQAAE